MDQALRYTLTRRDLVEAMVTVFDEADFGRRAVRTTQLTFVVGFGAFAVIAWFWMSPALTVVYAVMGILGVVFSADLAKSSYRRRVKKIATRDGIGAEGNYTLEITDAGLSCDWDGGTGLVKWPQVKSIHESEHLYVLGMGGLQITPIPKVPESGNSAAFITEVRERAGVPS